MPFRENSNVLQNGYVRMNKRVRETMTFSTIEAVDETQVIQRHDSWGGFICHHLQYHAEVAADGPDLVAIFLPALIAIAPNFFHDNLRVGVAYEAYSRPRHVGHE